MSSFSTRIATVAVIGALAVSFAVPSFAASRAKRTYVPADQSEYYNGDQNPQTAAHPNAPAIVSDQPNACFTDEGYGRYASCDQAGD